jgi:hypothetical protein
LGWGEYAVVGRARKGMKADEEEEGEGNDYILMSPAYSKRLKAVCIWRKRKENEEAGRRHMASYCLLAGC